MSMKDTCVFVFLTLCIIQLAYGQCPWLAPGAVQWTSPYSWPNKLVPGVGANVVISNGTIMNYDAAESGVTYSSITIQAGGQLIFDGRQNVVLETKYIWVQSGGSLIIGSSSCPFSTKATITLFGPRDNVTSIDGMGNKGIICAGTISMYGKVPQPTWANLVQTANASSSWIYLTRNTSWAAGDRLVIASTDYYAELSEDVYIKSITGKAVELTQPLKYMHWGADGEFAEVGILNRNILIQGDVSSDASTFGGHCIMYKNATAKISGVEFQRMGQAGIIGKYPFHWHVMGDQIGKGHFISDSSFHHNYQRCFTIHGTSGILAQRNVGFNVTGHCFFMEEGSETMNTLDGNLGIYLKNGKLTPSDATPSVFWITNPNNTIINNVAVGGDFGFWYALPSQPIGLTSYMTWILPRSTPLGKFDNNTAHSCYQNGLHADNGPTTAGLTYFVNMYSPLDPVTKKAVRATFTRVYAYKNRGYGIWMRGSDITITESVLQDNGVGVNMPVYGNLFANSTIVGETANIGTPSFTPFFYDQGRSRPRLWRVDFPIHGYEVYDNGGLQFARNITFINFVSNSVRRAGAIGQIESGYFTLPPTDIITQVTLINSNVWAMGNNTFSYDGPSHVVVHDADGSLTGSYGSYITSNNSMLTFDSNCALKPEWGGFFHCQMNANGYSHISVINSDIPNTNYSNSTSSWYKAVVYPLGRPDIADYITGGDVRDANREQYDVNVFSRKGYYMQFPHPTPSSLQVNLRYGSDSEWVVVVFSYPRGTTFSITRSSNNSPILPVTTLSALNSNTYYYDSANQFLYVMYVQDYGSLSSNGGFPNYGYGNNWVTIKASCGKMCLVTSPQTVPPALVDTADKYRAVMTSCGAGYKNSYEGNAFLAYEPSLATISYVIYHNIPQATYAEISNSVTGVVYTFPFAQSPMRGVLTPSWIGLGQLWNGDWSITVRSEQQNQTIKGFFGCVGICSAPPAVSAVDPCATVLGEAPMYTDKTDPTIGWIDWSWSATRNYSYTADKLCGSNSAQVNYSSYGSFSLHAGNGNCTPAGTPTACDAYWKKPFVDVSNYAYLEFYVKSPSGPILYPLNVRAQNQFDVELGVVPITSKYITNRIIDNNWTRVKVPLKDIGFKGNEYIGTFGIYVQWTGKTQSVLFDQIKLVPEYYDPLTKPAAGKQKTFVTPQC